MSEAIETISIALAVFFFGPAAGVLMAIVWVIFNGRASR
jgi:hypothetical protein